MLSYGLRETNRTIYPYLDQLSDDAYKFGNSQIEMSFRTVKPHSSSYDANSLVFVGQPVGCSHVTADTSTGAV